MKHSLMLISNIMSVVGMAQEMTVNQKEIEAIVVSAYERSYDVCNGYFYCFRGRYLYENGRYVLFGSDSYSNSFFYKKDYDISINPIDEDCFYYKDGDEYLDLVYKHNINIGPLEHKPFTSFVREVRTRTGFYEDKNMLFAVYRYKGTVIEYRISELYEMKEQIMEELINCTCCDGISGRYMPQLVDDGVFYINYKAEDLSIINYDEVRETFPFLEKSGIVAIEIYLCPDCSHYHAGNE